MAYAKPRPRREGAAPDEATGSGVVNSRVQRPADVAAAYALMGWPVLPTRPDRGACPDPPGKCKCKIPLTPSGFKDATTDPAVIRGWWRRWPAANVAIATGAPAVDVLDVDVKPSGSGWEAFNRLKRAGLLAGAQAYVRTPSTGVHLYFTGTGQPCGKLIRHYLDLKAAGGYVLAPPSRVHGRQYELIDWRDGTATLDWQRACRLLDPPRPALTRSVHRVYGGKSFDGVVRYLSGLKDGQERWRQLYWGACRAAELIAAGKLDELAARSALMEAAEVNGFIADHGEREAIRKIDRGLRDGAA